MPIIPVLVALVFVVLFAYIVISLPQIQQRPGTHWWRYKRFNKPLETSIDVLVVLVVLCVFLTYDFWMALLANAFTIGMFAERLWSRRHPPPATPPG